MSRAPRPWMRRSSAIRLNARASSVTSSPPASLARTSVRPSPSARAASSSDAAACASGGRSAARRRSRRSTSRPTPASASVGPNRCTATHAGGLGGTATMPTWTPLTTMGAEFGAAPGPPRRPPGPPGRRPPDRRGLAAVREIRAAAHRAGSTRAGRRAGPRRTARRIVGELGPDVRGEVERPDQPRGRPTARARRSRRAAAGCVPAASRPGARTDRGRARPAPAAARRAATTKPIAIRT